MSLCCLCSDYLIKHICGRSRNHSSLPPRISNLAEGAMKPGAWDMIPGAWDTFILHLLCFCCKLRSSCTSHKMY